MDDSDTSSEQHCKVFIGGLSMQTHQDAFTDYFSQYGAIKDSVILKDPNTNRSRGFGFVTYVNSQSVDQLLNDRPHTLDEKEVDVKRAIPRENNTPTAHSRTKKVFVGGLARDVTNDTVKKYFSKFGEIESVELIYDKNTETMRGFGFVTFTSCDAADKAIIDSHHKIADKVCEVKKAEPRTPGGGGGGAMGQTGNIGGSDKSQTYGGNLFSSASLMTMGQRGGGYGMSGYPQHPGPPPPPHMTDPYANYYKAYNDFYYGRSTNPVQSGIPQVPASYYGNNTFATGAYNAGLQSNSAFPPFGYYSNPSAANASAKSYGSDDKFATKSSQFSKDRLNKSRYNPY